MNRFRFVPNVPQLVSLAQVDGIYDSEKGVVTYHLYDGRVMVVSTDIATRINLLDLKPQETFWMCKRDQGDRTPPYFDVWLSPQTEQDRAKEEEAPKENKERVPPSPYDAPQSGKPKRRSKVHQLPEPPAEEPRLFDRGNGTTGPAPRPQPAASLRPEKIPYNVAFREVVGFVTKGLKDAGEQWTDAAKQDAITGILISASRDGLLKVWER